MYIDDDDVDDEETEVAGNNDTGPPCQFISEDERWRRDERHWKWERVCDGVSSHSELRLEAE